MNNLAVLLGKKSPNKEDSPDKSLFRHYWEKIEKAEKSFANAERKRGRIVERFNQEILPLEREFCKANYQLIEKLVSFLPGKSLSVEQKHEVIEWIYEQLDLLMNSPFRENLDIERIFSQLSDHEAKILEKPTKDELNMFKAQMTDMFADEDLPFDSDTIEDLVDATMDGPQAFFEELKKKASEFVNQEDMFDEEEFVSTKKDKRSEEELSDKSLSKLYKRLAQRIHPDRAKNDKDREKRHNLMLELTEAKRNKDTFSLLKMVRDYGEESDASFSDNQLKHFVEGLQQKLEDIRDKKRSLKTDSSIDSVIYSKFHSRTNKEMDIKFKEHREFLEREKQDLSTLFKSLKNVKQLKRELNKRSAVRNPFLNLALESDWG